MSTSERVPLAEREKKKKKREEEQAIIIVPADDGRTYRRGKKRMAKVLLENHSDYMYIYNFK